MNSTINSLKSQQNSLSKVNKIGFHVDSFLSNLSQPPIQSVESQPIVSEEVSNTTDWRNPSVTKVHKRSGRKSVSLEYWMKNKFTYAGSEDEFISKTQTLRACDKQILSHLIHFNAKGLPACMSQNYIAIKTCYSRGYINARIQHLMSLGLLDIYTRGKAGIQRSNVYQIAEQFFKKELWERMLGIPAVRSMFLMLLLVAPVMQAVPRYVEKPRLINECTLLNIKGTHLLNSNITDTSNIDKFVPKKRVTSMQKYNYSSNGSSYAYFSEQDKLKAKKRELQNYRDAKAVCKEQEERLKLLEAESLDEAKIASKQQSLKQIDEIFKDVPNLY